MCALFGLWSYGCIIHYCEHIDYNLDFHHFTEIYTPMSCLDAIDLCLKDQACKIILESMEKYCENVHSWTEFSNKEPVCSANCLQAIIDLSLNSIGSKWSHQCICHSTNQSQLLLSHCWGMMILKRNAHKLSVISVHFASTNFHAKVFCIKLWILYPEHYILKLILYALLSQ